MPIITKETSAALVLWWDGGPTAADIAEVVGILGTASRRGLPLHYICVVSDLASPPSSDGREAFLKEADQVMELSRSFQLVLAANPFVNSIARGLIAASGVQRRYAGKFEVHQHFDQAVMRVFERTQDEALLRLQQPEGAA